MSIKEAANLVIRSSSMAQGGELFILDMGEPIKIIDVARKMIHLSGNTIKSNSNPNGDIAIQITELLDSEKMHEELSVSNLQSTEDKKIFLSNDLSKTGESFENDIEYLLSLDDENQIINQLKKICED
jgi:FlaA1/EpsC-like NDP-sugar epimerase